MKYALQGFCQLQLMWLLYSEAASACVSWSSENAYSVRTCSVAVGGLGGSVSAFCYGEIAVVLVGYTSTVMHTAAV